MRFDRARVIRLGKFMGHEMSESNAESLILAASESGYLDGKRFRLMKFNKDDSAARQTLLLFGVQHSVINCLPIAHFERSTSQRAGNGQMFAILRETPRFLNRRLDALGVELSQDDKLLTFKDRVLANCLAARGQIEGIVAVQ